MSVDTQKETLEFQTQRGGLIDRLKFTRARLLSFHWHFDRQGNMV